MPNRFNSIICVCGLVVLAFATPHSASKGSSDTTTSATSDFSAAVCLNPKTNLAGRLESSNLGALGNGAVPAFGCKAENPNIVETTESATACSLADAMAEAGKKTTYACLDSHNPRCSGVCMLGKEEVKCNTWTESTPKTKIVKQRIKMEKCPREQGWSVTISGEVSCGCGCDGPGFVENHARQPGR